MGLQPTSSSNSKAHGRIPTPRRRSLQALTKGGYLQGPSTTLLPGKSLQRPQSFRGISTYNRSLSTEQICQSPSFYHDQSQHATEAHLRGSMGSVLRSPGRLPSRPHQEKPPQVHGLLPRPPTLLLQGSSLRPQRSPHDFLKNTETSSEPSSPGGHPGACIPGRLDYLGAKQDHSSNQSPKDSLSPKEPGLLDKLQEVAINPSFRHHLARGPLVPAGRAVGRSPDLQRENLPRSKSAPPCQNGIQKDLGVLHGEAGFPRANPQSPSSKHFAPVTSPVPGPSQAQGQKGASPRNPQGEPQDVVVSINATRPYALPAAPPQGRPMDRCIFVWLGCTFRQGSLLPGAVVHSRRDPSHQHPGGSGGHQGYRVPESPRPPHISSHRQRGSEICDQQAQVEGSGTVPLPNHALPSPQNPQPCNNCLQDPVLPEPHSRCPQQGPSPNDGMVSPHGRLQQNHCLERSGGGPNGDSPQQEGGDVRLSPSPSSSGSNRRQDGRLEHLEANLHLPSKEVHHSTSSQAPVVQIPRGVHRPLAAFSSLVPRTLPKGRRPLASARPARTIRSLRKSAKWLPKLRTLDRIQFLKEVYTATRGAKVASSLVHAFRKSSINQAETAWRAFKNWLPEHLTVLRKRHVLEFLVFLRDDKKLSPRTILGYRHSLSIPFKEAFDINFADRDFSLLARAQFHLSPPVKKKIPKWSLNHALETLQSPRFRNNTASLEDLFLKTIFLVAVASGNRCSELAACTREGISFEGDRVTIPTKEGFLFKNQTIDRTPPPVTFPSMASRHQLCPAFALSSYLEKSSQLPHKNTLFVHPKSGLPLLSGRLSYWIAKAIFTFDRSNKGTAHDCRKFGHSLAFTRGILPKTILTHGFWTTINVFIHKYLVPVEEPVIPCIAGRSGA